MGGGEVPVHKISYILIGLGRRSCLIPAWSHMKFISPIFHIEVINDEPESHLLGTLFFMTSARFSENGPKGLSLIQNCLEERQLT